MTRHHKNFLYILLIFFAAFGFAGCEKIKSYLNFSGTPAQEAAEPQEKPGPDAGSQPEMPLPANIVVRIGKWSVSEEDFKDRLTALKEVVPDIDIDDPETKALVREELIRQQLIVVDAERTGLAKQKDIVDAVEEFRRTLIVREAVAKLLENVTVSDTEAKAFYDARKSDIVNPVEWHVREIVVESEEKARAVLVQVIQGGDFAELARQQSIGETAENGGDLGYINDVPFQEMARPLLSLKEGENSTIFEGPDGFYIIKLEKKKGGDPIPFDEIKQDIIDSLTIERQQQAILKYIENLRKKIRVEANNDLIQ